MILLRWNEVIYWDTKLHQLKTLQYSFQEIWYYGYHSGPIWTVTFFQYFINRGASIEWAIVSRSLVLSVNRPISLLIGQHRNCLHCFMPRCHYSVIIVNIGGRLYFAPNRIWVYSPTKLVQASTGFLLFPSLQYISKKWYKKVILLM